MGDLISIIVPIFNVEKYLERCIESLIGQTYHNIEIILVDDGSKDNGLTVCQNYEKLDSRIKVVHKENGGITTARKAGIRVAQGKYIGFVDGDDWVEAVMYKKLYEQMINFDVQIVLSGMYRENDNGIYAKWKAGQIADGLYKSEEKKRYVYENLFLNGVNCISGSLNNKLFLKELLTRNLEKVDDRIHGYEDDLVCTIPCILEAGGIYVTEEAYYHGYDRANSTTHSKNEHWYEQLNFVFFRLRESFESHSYAEVLLPQLKTYIINGIMNGIPHFFDDISIPRYYIREENRKEKLILYGAGVVGQSYYTQLLASGAYEIVLWIDKNHEDKILGMEISSIEQIEEAEYDKIIIAQKSEKVAGEIKCELMKHGIPDEKIVWKQPLGIYEYYKMI